MSTHLRSSKVGSPVAWLLRASSNWIPPLHNYLHRLSQKYAAEALESYVRHDLDVAAQNYQEAIVWNVHDPTLHSALGQVYHEQNNGVEAEKEFRKALEYDYQNLRALKGLGVILQERDDLLDSMYLYLRYLEVEPKDAFVLHNLAVVFHNLGDYESALDYYERAENEDPKDALIRKNRGVALLALGRAEEARAELLQAGTLDPKDAEVDRLLGSTLAANNELETALKYYESALKKDSKDADSHLELASLLVRLDRCPEAVEHSSRAAELFSEAADTEGTVRAYWELGWDTYLVGDWERSLRASNEALQFDPNLAPLYFNIGLVLLHLGRDAEARKRYDDGIQNLAQLADLKYYAIDDLDEALKKNPDLTGGSEILNMLKARYDADSQTIQKTAGHSTT